MRSKITSCDINEHALSLGPRLSLFSEVSYSSRAQQRSYSIYAVFQDIEGVVIIKLWTDRANAKHSVHSAAEHARQT